MANSLEVVSANFQSEFFFMVFCINEINEVRY